MSWKQVCFHRVCVGCFVEPPSSLLVVFYGSISSFHRLRELTGQKIGEEVPNCGSTSCRGHGNITHSAETFLWSQRHEKYLLVHISWGGKLDLLLCLVTTLRNTNTGFFLCEISISSKACRLSWLVMDRVGKEGRPKMWHIGDLAFTLMYW